MSHGVGRVAGGLVLLVALWISVYWWWPSTPPVTYAQSEDAIRGVQPKDPPIAAPTPQTRPAPQEPEPGPAQAPPQPAPRVEELPNLKQAVIPPEFIEHTVQKGETFETIAKKYHGPRAPGSIIAKANPMMDPTRLMPGRVVLVPKDPGNIQGVPAPPQDPVPPSAPEEYIVQEGDTLTRIAQEVYGESRLWTLIRDANRDRLTSESSLKIGQRLRIPARPDR